MLQLMCKDCPSSVNYLFVLLSELEQCRVNQIAPVLTWQHRIQTRILLVKSLMLLPLHHCATSSSLAMNVNMIVAYTKVPW